MTPEERFTTIENMMKALTEGQVRNEAEIEKNSAAIRDLIMVSRTLVDAQMRTDGQIKELREAQKETDVKLKALIDTVDRIIRHGRNGHEQ